MSNEIEAYEPSNTTDLMMNSEAMERMFKLSELMSEGRSTIPKHLQGSPSDCMAIVIVAAQWRMSPFAVAQKTHLVNGVLGYEAQLVNSVVSSSKAIRGRFKYEYEGEWKSDKEPTARVRTGAVLSGETDITWGEWIYPATITTKNSPLWKTNPKQQAAYLAVKYWSRLYCPDVILGVYTPDELEDRGPVEKDITPQKPAGGTRSSSLVDKLGGSPKKAPIEGQSEAVKQAEVPADMVDLKAVVEEIEHAGDEDELNQTARYAEKLPREEQPQARSAYRLRLAELRDEQIDPQEDGGFIITTAKGEKIKI